jgi:hypothetical protein
MIVISHVIKELAQDVRQDGYLRHGELSCQMRLVLSNAAYAISVDYDSLLAAVLRELNR